MPLSSSLTGIQFTNRLTSAQIAGNRLMEDGSGVALGDINGDGRCDIFLCSLSGDNRLYLNQGDWRFKDITEEAGVRCAGQSSTGAVLEDMNGDGNLDLLVNSLGGGTRLFFNDGKGHFHENSGSGLIPRGGSHSLAVGDVDGDGHLDIYVANYRSTTAKDFPVHVKLKQSKGHWSVPVEHRDQFIVETGPGGTVVLLEVGESDVLYLGDGQGHFQPQSWTQGHFLDESGHALKEAPRDWGLSVQIRDINGDGLPDIYVCNDYFTPDRIWINQGHGTFRLLPRLAVRKTSWASMGVDMSDIDRDGHPEMFVTEMLSRDFSRRKIQHSLLEIQALPQWGWGWNPVDWESRTQAMRNTLEWNRGDGTFAEIGELAGIHASEWSWGCLFLDVDLDGYEDLLVANGHSRDLANSDSLAQMDKLPAAADATAREKTLGIFPPLPLSHIAFRNQGNRMFKDMSQAWGFNLKSAATGMAVGDLDNDGDLDVVINNLNGEASILRNEGSGKRLAVRLKGAGGNTQGIGAKLRVRGGPVEQTQEVISGGRYLSGADPLRVFAVGGGSNLVLEVEWRSGKRSEVRGLEGNELVEVEESGAGERRVETKPEVPTMYEEVSGRLNLQHHETEFDDFERQPLMPWRLSQLGPGVVWFDLNGDGVDDLIVGSGRGGRLRVMAGNGKGGFGEVNSSALEGMAGDDLTGMVAWSAEAGSASLRVGMANYESGRTNGVSVLGYEVFFGEIKSGETLAGNESSTGPLALADMDGDGDLDLFVGGRVMGGQYPRAASSRIYRNEGGRMILDEANSRKLAGVGLVSGAVWTDLDGDGYPELVLACEWGGIRVYGNQGGELNERTSELGLESYLGLWTGVTAGDFDGDGRMDLVVGNWGRNTVYEESIGKELRLYHGDVDGNGSWDIIEAQWDPGLGKVVPRRDWKTVGQAIPMVQERFNSYGAYGRSSVEEIYGTPLGSLQELRVKTLESVVLLNRGGKFEAKPLPFEAQVAPVFGLCVGDYDGDGKEDLFVAQNFFGTDRETGRYDAGRGQWLQGDGHGGWRAVPGQESGVKVYGEQRGAALSDFDGDGRVDLAVSQNAAGMALYRNRGGRPGLRVRLSGPVGNANGLGAIVRLGEEGKLGAARELHGGGGYWSQDSSTTVMARPSNPKSLMLQVAWPGGRSQQYPVPAAAQEVEASIDGSLKVVR